MDPVTALRMEMEMVPVPDGYATSGMYYCDQENDLQELFDEECHESARGAMKAEQRLKKFQRAVRNIEHAAATVIQRNARRFFQFTDDANDTDYTTEFDEWSREELIEKILDQRAMLDSCADYLFQIHGYANQDDEEERRHREQVAEIDEYYVGGYDAYLEDMEDERAELEEKAREAYEDYTN